MDNIGGGMKISHTIKRLFERYNLVEADFWLIKELIKDESVWILQILLPSKRDDSVMHRLALVEYKDNIMGVLHTIDKQFIITIYTEHMAMMKLDPTYRKREFKAVAKRKKKHSRLRGGSRFKRRKG